MKWAPRTNHVSFIKRASLLTKVFAAIAFSVVIPLLVMLTYTDAAFMRSFEQEIAKAGLGKLKIAGKVGDMIFESLETTGMRIAVDPRLTTIAGLTRLDSLVADKNGTFAVMEFQNILSDLVRTNSLYQSIEVIPAQADFSMSSAAGTTVQATAAPVLDSAGVRVITRKDPSDSRIRLFSYVYPLTSYISLMRGTVVINILETAFCDRVNAGNNEGEGTIGVVTTDGTVLSDVNKAIVGTKLGLGAELSGRADAQPALGAELAASDDMKRIAASNENEGYFTTETGGRRMLVTYLKVPERELVYVGRFSLELMGRNLGALRNNTVAASLVLIAIGLCGSWILSRRLSNPVRKLAQDIRERKLFDATAHENEIHLISRAFETLERRETQLFSAAERNRNKAEQARILELMEGLVEERTLESGTRGAGGQSRGDSADELFPLPFSACAIVGIDNAARFADSKSPERQYYLKSLLLGMAEEVFRPDTIARGVVTDGNRIALVLNFAGAGEDWITSLQDRFRTLKHQAQKVLDTSISMAVSGRGRGLRSLAAQYQEARSLWKLRFIRGHGSFIGDQEPDRGGYFYPKAMEQQIVAALDTGDSEAVDESVRELIDNLSSSRSLSYDNVMLILNQLTGSVVHYLIDRNVRIADVFGAEFNVYERLAENETLADTREWLSALLRRVIGFFAAETGDDRGHRGKIMDYVQNNYMKGFDINMIADSVGLSYSHVRKVFQDSYGENILRFVNNLRICEAKRMLRETALNVNDIALSLGYNNTQSFTRYFKKYVRLTPGAYRIVGPESRKNLISKTDNRKQ